MNYDWIKEAPLGRRASKYNSVHVRAVRVTVRDTRNVTVSSSFAAYEIPNFLQDDIVGEGTKPWDQLLTGSDGILWD